MHYVWRLVKSLYINPLTRTQGWDHQTSTTTFGLQVPTSALCNSESPSFTFKGCTFLFCVDIHPCIYLFLEGSLILPLPPRFYYPFPPMGPMLYHMELSVGGQQFIGRGRTRQLAKHDAAAKALKVLHKEPILQQLPVVREEVHTYH